MWVGMLAERFSTVKAQATMKGDSMRKLIFLDLDGTIIDHSIHAIPKSAVQAINKARANGHEVVLATGRPPSLTGLLLKEIHFDAFVGANGRYVSYEGEVLRKKVIPRKTLDAFLEDMDAHDIDVAFLGTKDYFIRKERPNELVHSFSEHYHIPYPKLITDPDALNDVLQMVMFFNHEGSLESFNRKYPELDFNISSPYTADVNTKDGLKEIGIKVFTDYLDIPIEDTIAIGDGHNDISMIQLAGTGVAMGNACEPLKNAADIVTDTVSNDGLYKAFETLKLI